MSNPVYEYDVGDKNEGPYTAPRGGGRGDTCEQSLSRMSSLLRMKPLIISYELSWEVKAMINA